MIYKLVGCDLMCALVNQSVLYIATFVAPLAVILFLVKLFNMIGFHGIGMLIALATALFGLSFYGLVPIYVSILVTGVAIWSLINKKIKTGSFIRWRKYYQF